MKFCCTRNNLVFLFLLLFSLQIRAQVSTSSPYSRYGIGDIQFGGFAKNLGMGGISQALMQPYNINFLNPASYAGISLTTFEAAGNGSMYELYTSESEHAYQYNADFAYLALGFPIKAKKWGMSFGIQPFSSVGYNITDRQTNTAGDNKNHIYEGSGGLNQFYLGTGFTLAKNFYAGVNASFLFGTIDQLRRVEYSNLNYYNTKITEETIINDFYFSAGLLKIFDSLAIAKSDSLNLFDVRIEAMEDSIAGIRKSLDVMVADTTVSAETIAAEKSKSELVIASLNSQILQADSSREKVQKRRQKSTWALSIGLTGSPSLSLKAKHTELTQSYYLVNEIEYIVDTVTNKSDNEGKLVLPLNLGFGIALKQGTHWTIGADFSLQNWQDYSLFGIKDSLANSWRTSAGFQWTPNDRSIKSYFSLVQYRFGAHYEQSYLNLHNTQLTDIGVSLGFGFPMKRVATTIQFAIEAGRRGTVSNNLVEMNYVKCTLGFTLNDRWFVKQKFD